MSTENRILISRRDALRAGLLGAAGLASGSHVSFAVPAPSQTPAGKARAVIQIWMWGGPAHLDTFDPKPDAGDDYTGPLKSPIPTNVDGIRIGELLPLLAQQADKYSPNRRDASRKRAFSARATSLSRRAAIPARRGSPWKEWSLRESPTSASRRAAATCRS